MLSFAQSVSRTAGVSRAVVGRLVGEPSAAWEAAGMFIQTQPTPNPDSLKFVPGEPVLGDAYGGSLDFPSIAEAKGVPLARALFRLEGVTRVFFGRDFVSVTKDEAMEWGHVKPAIFGTIMDFYTNQQAIIDPNVFGVDRADDEDDDDEVVATIKELLDTRIRPYVQEDGGDIRFHSMTEEGIVMLEMQGSCSGCPSSTATLKNGIENMLMHYIDEVKGVEPIESEAERVAREAFEATEAKLAGKQQ